MANSGCQHNELGDFTLSLDLDDDEFLSTIDLGSFDLMQSSHSNEATKEIDRPTVDLTETDEPDEPKVKRFKALGSKDLDNIEQQHQSMATKKNTQWGVNLFQGNFST